MNTEALQWFKSTYSGSEGGECLEVAFTGGESAGERAVHVRDSKNPAGPTLRITSASWAAFSAYAAR